MVSFLDRIHPIARTDRRPLHRDPGPLIADVPCLRKLSAVNDKRKLDRLKSTRTTRSSRVSRSSVPSRPFFPEHAAPPGRIERGLERGQGSYPPQGQRFIVSVAHRKGRRGTRCGPNATRLPWRGRSTASRARYETPGNLSRSPATVDRDSPRVKDPVGSVPSAGAAPWSGYPSSSPRRRHDARRPRNVPLSPPWADRQPPDAPSTTPANQNRQTTRT